MEFLGSEHSPQPIAPKPDPDELGHPVALSFVMGRNEIAAVGITSFVGYHSGFEFALAMVFADPDNRLTPLNAMHRTTLALVTDVATPPDPEGFRLTLTFSDHSSVSCSTIGPFRELASRQQHEQVDRSLTLLDGYGGGVKSHLRWFVSPLPPPGRIVFSCEWPAVGISWRHEVDTAQQLIDAAKESRFLFQRSEE
jgi:hypothetical protein